MQYDTLLETMFQEALKVSDPFHAVAKHLPAKPKGRVLVVGAGKASARMAQAVETQWGPCEGMVIVPIGAALPTEKIELIEARHPVPNQAGETAARRILAQVGDLSDGDLVLCLISGGGSSLMAAPADGLTLEDKQMVNRALLASGAAIDEMNTVRKHLSAIKGGRLAAAAYPAQIVTLLISDVPGDDPSIIASGPTVVDNSTAQEARDILTRYGIDLPAHIQSVLASAQAETPAPDHPVFQTAQTVIIAAPQNALDAAAQVADAAGVATIILGDAIEGESRDVGTVMAGIAKQVLRHDQPVRAPAVILSGGETTVTVQGTAGKGGRCSEFLLSFALSVWDEPRITALACDTDGRDGSEQNAGAQWAVDYAAKCDRKAAQDYLSRHDAFSFFEAVGGLINTGPTHTNVNDFRAILVLPDEPDAAE